MVTLFLGQVFKADKTHVDINKRKHFQTVYIFCILDVNFSKWLVNIYSYFVDCLRATKWFYSQNKLYSNRNCIEGLQRKQLIFHHLEVTTFTQWEQGRIWCFRRLNTKLLMWRNSRAFIFLKNFNSLDSVKWKHCPLCDTEEVQFFASLGAK